MLVSPTCWTRLGVGNPQWQSAAARPPADNVVDRRGSPGSDDQRCSNTAASVTKALASSLGKTMASGPVLQESRVGCQPGASAIGRCAVQRHEGRHSARPEDFFQVLGEGLAVVEESVVLRNQVGVGIRMAQ